MFAHLGTFLLAITLLTMIPGVDTLMVIRNSVRGGWRDGAVTSLGICCGLFVHATVSAIGISVILLQTAWAFALLKLVGAGYLMWLGATTLIRSRQQPSYAIPESLTPPARKQGDWRSFREGFLSNVLNPKTILFYMAFLPQFIDPQRSALAQSLLLAGIHFMLAMIWQCLVAWGVTHTKRRFSQRTASAGRLFQGVTGSILLAIGARLAVEQPR